MIVPSIEPWLREILRCPSCLGELADATGPTGGPELTCRDPQCALAFRVEDGIPVLLLDEARVAGGGSPGDARPRGGRS